MEPDDQQRLGEEPIYYLAARNDALLGRPQISCRVRAKWNNAMAVFVCFVGDGVRVNLFLQDQRTHSFWWVFVCMNDFCSHGRAK